MIDHEFRIITPVLKKLIKKKSIKEKTLVEKIPNLVIQNNYLDIANKRYLKDAKLIKSIYYRGLPINNKKDYLEQENQLHAIRYCLNPYRKLYQ